MAVYLLHSDVPLLRSNGSEVAHYVGWAPDGEVGRRLKDHLKGRNPAVLVQAFLDKGGTLWLGNHWRGATREYEYRLKRMGHLNRRCFLCKISALEMEWTEALLERNLLLSDGAVPLRKHVGSRTPYSLDTTSNGPG